MTEFERCWPWLAKALDRTNCKNHTKDSLQAALASGHAQLWPAEDGVLVTELVTEGRMVRAWLGGGSLTAVMDLRPGIEAWGRSQGCEMASVEGRKGWERVFRPFGYVRDGDELKRRL